MSKKKQLFDKYELTFTKEDSTLISERSYARGIICDLDYLQAEVDKLIMKWKEEELPCFL